MNIFVGKETVIKKKIIKKDIINFSKIIWRYKSNTHQSKLCKKNGIW